jgi:hypothetical protein
MRLSHGNAKLRKILCVEIIWWDRSENRFEERHYGKNIQYSNTNKKIEYIYIYIIDNNKFCGRDTVRKHLSYTKTEPSSDWTFRLNGTN